ncbi:MAG: dihydrofolate reductase family protein, partial [Clostridia bacterium]|nr:dihydrofolate reductase family protein [Clostridia bacterium]
KEGLYQYYEAEAQTDLFSLNTGRVMAKIGVNSRKDYRGKIKALTFVIIDNKPHLYKNGIDYLCRWAGRVILVTTNKAHPAFELDRENLTVILYEKFDLETVLCDLYRKFGVRRLTVQSGGALNGLFVRKKLLDYVDIFIAPILVGGGDVPTLADGEGIKNDSELYKLMPLELLECNKLENSYVRLRYKVIK